MELEKVKEIISELKGIPEDSITMETTFLDDLNADSLDVFQIISELEEYFELEFEAEDLENIQTVGDAVNYIKSALGK